MTLSWTKPDCDDRVPIRGYTVEYKKGTRGNWVKASRDLSDKTTLTITNLEEGTVYQFQVCAENVIGKGIFSDMSDACKTLGEFINRSYSFVLVYLTQKTESVSMHIIAMTKYVKSVLTILIRYILFTYYSSIN